MALTTVTTGGLQDKVRAGSSVPGAPKTGYIRTLDGWRTVAISAVMLYHAPAIVVAGRSLRPVQEFGNRGVQLFFAISGLLICSRLLEEQRVCGRISLKGFYLRRLFRIQPAAMVFLGVGVLLTLMGVIHLTLPATLSALFSYRNFYAAFGWATSPDDKYTVHFWSLAVEEHFYLILPALLLVGRRWLVAMLGLLSAVFFVWPPVAHRLLHLTDSPLAQFRTDLALRDLFVPALLAVLLTDARFRDRVTRVTNHGVLLLAVVVVIVAAEMRDSPLTGMVTCLGFPCLIVSTMMHPRQWLGRLLESRVMRFVGRISYSLYLWQQLFFVSSRGDSALRYAQRFPVSLCGALLCAVASYYLVEKPMIRLGHRFAPPATPGREDLRQTAA